MNKLATFTLLFLSTLTAPAATQPKVAFVGDWLTASWSTTFPANWVNEATVAAAIAQRPSLIHVMIGSAYICDDASFNIVTAWLEQDLVQDITQARAAGIPVMIGIEPTQFIGPQGLGSADIEVYAIATQYGVPVINYSGAFNGAAEGFAGSGSLYAGPAPNGSSLYQPTAAGYAIMTMMAQTAFSTANAQPKSVYLQDTAWEGENNPGGATLTNVNTVNPGNTAQFYPVISYTNGVSEQAGFNTNFLTGQIGTWTSSNPLVGYVNQSGSFGAFNEGSTIVKFTLPNGVWNEWIMYVNAPAP